MAPPTGIVSVSVRVSVHPTSIWMGFEVDHDKALLLPDHPFGRRDNLWNSTCFELFARQSDSERYVEYNFAPVWAWAAYEFDRYRYGMRNAVITDPHVVHGLLEDRASEIDHFYEFSAVVAREGLLAASEVQIGLSAVIEELDGTKSYWALRHPPGDKPDFHHPDCFALELPPALEP